MTRSRLLPLWVSVLCLTAAVGGLLWLRGVRAHGGQVPAPAMEFTTLARMPASSDTRSAAPARDRAADPLDDTGAATLLVRDATVSLEISAYAEAAARVEAIVAGRGGYLAGAQVERESGDRQRGTLTVRVRADRFDEALHAIQALGKVESIRLDTRDVGREYVDVQTRLRAKTEAEARLRELQTRTARLSDVIEAEKELSRVIEEREALEGQKRFLDRQVALSTIAVELHEPASLLGANALAPLREALRRAVPLLASSAAALLYLFAAAVPWALVVLAVWSVRRRFATRRFIRAAMER
jgi:Domain of unknown function (DUF4349)